MNKTIQLSITGMHCASCEKLIKLSVEELPGIQSVTVHSDTNTGDVIFDETQTNETAVLEKITAAGYTATIT